MTICGYKGVSYFRHGDVTSFYNFGPIFVSRNDETIGISELVRLLNMATNAKLPIEGCIY